MHSYSVRTFRDGDEKEIVELFNEVYKKYGGFVPRAIEYWRWCCLERPDVEQNGIFLALDNKKLCGYLVAGSSGNIWEFCATNDEVARVLLAEALPYLEKVGVSSVNISIPQDSSAAGTLTEAGFSKVPAETMFMTTLNPQVLVSTLAASRKEELISKKINDEFEVRLHGAPHGVETEFSMKIRGETVEIVEGFPSHPSVVIALSFVDFLSVLFGFSNAGRLFLVRKMKVRPLWKLNVVLKFLSVFRSRRSWFFPLSDFG
jgi:hypothetical protein